jgi:hypothetical protein
MAGEVTGSKELAYENDRLSEQYQSLTVERDSLMQEMAQEKKVHDGQVILYLAEIEQLNLHNTKMGEAIGIDTPLSVSLGPWPREE